ncbi:unnamed protein product [Diatraea saccharalis]|uniref:SCP domain-containing protein n=1 Tax=Diatraea saccharalis TaxID=40085 RepID=A0A9N9QU03_9NEOP|nr:unnamed protein product [Diatraea saccharalis]
MSTPRSRPNDTVELLPLKSALVNNNYREDDAYYAPQPPLNNNPSSSNLYDYTLLSKRTPASKRLLSKQTQPAPTPLVTLCGAPPPSRKREELAALANLRKKVAPALLPDKKSSKNNNEPVNKDDNETEQLDNRPKLLQRYSLLPGHFTQMVWVATRFFGVGKARSRAGKVIVVANYSPPGNISGQFETNVLPPLPENFPEPPPPAH